jgi:uncharacterized membrane protein
MVEERQLTSVATLVYALQAAGFLLPPAWIVALIIDYAKKNDARGTWLESHFRWQMPRF